MTDAGGTWEQVSSSWADLDHKSNTGADSEVRVLIPIMKLSGGLLSVSKLDSTQNILIKHVTVENYLGLLCVFC